MAMMFQCGAAKERFAGPMGVLMVTDSASTERKFLSLFIKHSIW